LVIDFHGFGETALLSWWTRAPKRWGILNRRSRAWAYTHSVYRNRLLHPAQVNLELLHRAGGIKPSPISEWYLLPKNIMNQAQDWFRKQGLNESMPTLFIQPFSSDPRKDWPLKCYLVAAAHWKARGIQVLFGSGPADLQALEPARRAGFPVAAGASLLVSAGLANLSGLVLGGDTGLLH